MKPFAYAPPLPGRVARFAVRTFKSFTRLHHLKRLGIHRIPPNFLLFHDLIPPNATVIDVGCSYEADFSVAMIERYGATAIAVDPTMKHRSALAKLADKYPLRFQHVPFAIAAQSATTTFFESRTTRERFHHAGPHQRHSRRIRKLRSEDRYPGRSTGPPRPGLGRYVETGYRRRRV